MKYPVVKTAWILSFILSPMPAPLLYTIRWKCAMLTEGEQEQQGVVLTDEGPRGQQEGGRESRRFLFGTSYGTCVGYPSRCSVSKRNSLLIPLLW